MNRLPIVRIAPSPDSVALAPFRGIGIERICLPGDAAACAEALRELLSDGGPIGFDTESRPTFRVGERSDGPHLIQFATRQRAYLLRVAVPGCLDAARAVLENHHLVKVGFGLKSDRSHLHSRLGIRLHACIDLGSVLRYVGIKGQVGLRGAVAGLLQQAIPKSRRLATSNWASLGLSEAQQRYAADDAFGALQVFHALEPAVRQALLEQALGD
ncbi:3'-5' exonuclease [Pseudomonas oligotrophica]|uniref:3'-5' exonuclease n=1 Tax=Pseudomonas oligotrophica TaxID=2912055 RepID=UPI001F277E8C|nr:3'-5' exonuclease [Pseudomonas oligotrophica]MCF7202553.1 3'-5' exonuclease domain-containing protein 2 [Pseudomonas oligotrophica]